MLGSLWDDLASITLGLFYMNEKGSEDNWQSMPGISYQRAFSSWIKANSYAIFADSDIKLTEKLTLSGGLRYTYEQKSADKLEYNPITGQAIFDAHEEAATKISSENFSPRLGLSYQFTGSLFGWV